MASPAETTDPEIIRFARLMKCLRILQKSLFAHGLRDEELQALRDSERHTDDVVAWIERNRKGTLHQAALKVKLMRVHQRHFVAGNRSRETVGRAKEMERHVDSWIRSVLNTGEDTQQSTLSFGPVPVGEIIGHYTRDRERGR